MKGKITSWVFFILFLIIGVLNAVLIHPVPGIFYVLISLVYVPYTNVLLKQKFGFSIPLWAKILLALLILWPTLAVGDLAELLGL